jgi:8-oxo-dGTP pyrophosphatase MutT (NUDIX family)
VTVGPEGQPATGTLEDAVTVILVRDAPGAAGDDDRLEVLLLERHGASAFAPGALVFPGGKLDPTDAGLDPGRVRCTDPEGVGGTAWGSAARTLRSPCWSPPSGRPSRRPGCS